MRHQCSSIAVIILATVLATGCSDSSAPPAPPANVTPVDAATAGRIDVDVAFAGEAPAPKEINLRAVAACAALHASPVYDQAVRVSAGKLADAVVYIKDGLGDRPFAFPRTPVVIDQKGCLYAPAVAALMVGQPLKFVNSDPEAHNVHGHPQVNRGWNFMMSQQGSERTVYFAKPEIGAEVRCDVHPWMLAHVSAFAHPYFAVTPADGRATLAQVPPGQYTVAAWHRVLGATEQKVTLDAKGTARVELRFALK
jgi:plastocyanin